MNRTSGITSVVIGTSGLLFGCGVWHPTIPATAPVAALATTYGTTAMAHGPRATFVNESTLTLTVRYWSGRRDSTAPGGVADIRTDDAMAFTAKPGEFFITQTGRPWWPTSMTDAVVRARIDIEGSNREPIWLELEQPGPFKIAAVGCCEESLEFRRFGGGPISAVPRDQWIDGNNGPFPVYLYESHKTSGREHPPLRPPRRVFDSKTRSEAASLTPGNHVGSVLGLSRR